MLLALDDEEDAMPLNTNELQSYLSLPGSPDGVDVLDYWKKNANLFPTLTMMARDIYAVPISTVPSESCFSSANRILTDKRYAITFTPIIFMVHILIIILFL